MKRLILPFLAATLAGQIGTALAKAKKESAAPARQEAGLQQAIFTVKGIPLRLSEKYLRQLFPDLVCQDSSLGVMVETTCELNSGKRADMNLAGHETESYRFRLAGGEVIGIAVLLPNSAFEDVVSRIKEVYGAPRKTTGGIIETNDDGQKLDTLTLIWARGVQTLRIKSHDRDVDTMSISLSGTGGES